MNNLAITVFLNFLSPFLGKGLALHFLYFYTFLLIVYECAAYNYCFLGVST